ncbi:MAG TPA: VOC family protein [Candidatus Binatia bacterium]|jgi:methylmalonyl-CoA/ethylmalonyl-CoA epimerase
MIQRISHIGFVVSSMDDALALWCDRLGMRKCAEAVFEVEGIRSVFVSVSGEVGEMCIELMEPLDKNDMTNAVARRLATKGEGFYHLAVVVDDVDASGRLLRDRSFDLIDRPPTGNAKQGRWLIRPREAGGVMVEGIEEWKDEGL